MKTKKDILFLAKNGLSSPVISSFSDRQVKILVERFKKFKKEETSEAWTETSTTSKTLTAPVAEKDLPIPPAPAGKTNKITVTGGTIQLTQNEGEMTEDVEVATDPNKETETQDPKQVGPSTDDGNNNYTDGMDIPEGVIKEKFESKAQQGLFWARCNKCSSKNCKWCKMAKEFSDSTSKKQYKKRPEKKHPEKTVKTKKEKANENFQKFLEEKITKMVDEKIEPKMKKKDLVKTIKKKVKNNDSMILRNPKKLTMFSDEAPMNLPIGQMFSIGKK
jgi:hypothetical protein